MKAYGHSRRDKLECGYGCCTTKSGPMKSCRKVNDREHRKRARQAAANEIAAFEAEDAAQDAATVDVDCPSDPEVSALTLITE